MIDINYYAYEYTNNHSIDGDTDEFKKQMSDNVILGYYDGVEDKKRNFTLLYKGFNDDRISRAYHDGYNLGYNLEKFIK